MANLDGLCYMRTHRPAAPFVYPVDERFELRGCKQLRNGNHITLVSAGFMVHSVLEAAHRLADKGVEFLKKQPGLDVDFTTGLNEAEACEHIREAEAVIVRSATSIRGDILEAGKNLLSDMANKLTAVKQLSDYELHIMLDVLLVHKRTGSN